MKVGKDFDHLYEESCEDLRDLGPIVENLIRELLNAKELRVHSVAHRVKAPQNVRRKLSDKETSYASLDEMHDLLGVRVITFFPDEVDRVAELIEIEFDTDRPNSVDKRSLLDPDRFGYLSLHYVASLNTPRAQLTEHARFDGRKFEIQIRSILQHAWAEIEHDLGYHTPGAIPNSVRRRFSRLAGLLEIADDEFRRLRNDVSEYQEAVGEEVADSPDLVPVNRDSVAALIASNAVIAAVDADLAQIASAELLETSGETDALANGRATELLAVGLGTAGEVVRALEERQGVLQRFFTEWTKDRSYGGIYPGGSLISLAYVMAAETGSVDSVVGYLNAVDIGTDLAERQQIAEGVLEAYALAMGSSARRRPDYGLMPISSGSGGWPSST